MATEYLDKTGLTYFWGKIKSYFTRKDEAIKNITRSGTTFTATRADDTTFTFTQQDSDTTYSAATESAEGLMSASDKTKLNRVKVVPFIIGTQTAATGSWTGSTNEISSLEDGQEILYWLPYAGSGNATLNLTLNGTETGALPCYYGGTGRLTTHYGAGNVIRLTYREDAVISGGSTTYTGWWADANYDTNTYDRVRFNGYVLAESAITAGGIIVGKDGKYFNLNSGAAFDITYPILYAASAINANATGSGNYTQSWSIAISTTQSMTLTTYKPVFIKGQLSGTIFTPVSTTPLTQTVPTSEDGYEYILLGVAVTTANIIKLYYNPVFAYKGSSFGEVSGKGITDLSVSGKTVTYTRADGTTGTITTQDTTYNDATESAHGLMPAADKQRFNGIAVAFGTCTTAATEQEKVATVGNGFTLITGAIVGVKFSNTNTYSATASNPCKLNVNDTGPKNIYYNNSATPTGTNTKAFGYANRTNYYMYDGTYWVFMSGGVDDNSTYNNMSLGNGYGTCTTAAATAEKVVTLASYNANAGGIIGVKFTNGNSAANPTLNVNNKGAKAIFYKGEALGSSNTANWIISDGDIAFFLYDGTQYHLIGIDNSLEKLRATNPRSRQTDFDELYGDGAMRYFMATSSAGDNRPSFSGDGAAATVNDSTILHLGWDNPGGFDCQLAVRNATGQVSVRGGTGKTDGAQNWTDWKPLAFAANAISNITRSGTTFTATRADGTTFTFDQQDNDTKALGSMTGTLAIGHGGTGATSITNAANNLQVQSLGHGTAIGAETDLDTLDTIGNYHCDADVTSKTLSNRPSGLQHAFTMKVGLSTGTANPYQEIIRYTDGCRWYRRKSGGSWASWNEYGKDTWRGIQNNLTSDSTTDSLSAAQGKALANGSARDNTKLPLTGGTLTGDLILTKEGTTSADAPARIYFKPKDTDKDTQYSNAYIAVYNDHQAAANGTNMVIHTGGSIILGSGESPASLYTAVQKNTSDENTFIVSDGVVNVESNANTLGNRCGFRLNTAHDIIPIKAGTPTNNVGQIGNSTYKWNAVHATEFVGNASTATKLASAKTISLTGDVTGSASFDGSANASITATVADDSHNHTLSTIIPAQTKTYTGVIGTADTNDDTSLMFIRVIPDAYESSWTLHYRITATITGVSDANGNGKQVSELYTAGMRNTYSAYHVWNEIMNTSYRPYYGHLYYRLKEAGFNAGYAHGFGVRLKSSYQPINTSYPRTITVEILESSGCSVTFTDNPILLLSWPGFGSTNYEGLTVFDGSTQGLTTTGDRNDVNYYNRNYYACRKTYTALYRYQLCATRPDRSLVPMNTVNGSVATNKTMTTESFDPFGDFLYWASTTTYNANANVGDGWYAQYLADFRYTFNIGGNDVASTLVGRKPLYLVTVPQSDGLVKLHSSPLAQDLPTTEDGLLYIYLGQVYPDTRPYRVYLTILHPVYWYKNGSARLYTATDIYVNKAGDTMTGALGLTTTTATTKCKLEYNETNNCLDFVFE